MAGTEVADGVELRAPAEGRDEELLSADALAFIAELHRRFDGTRRELLSARAERQARLDAGELPDFLEETREIREGDWRVAPVPADLQDRRVEITGPVDRKMVINALNSGARCFMADFEDANSPTWRNNLDGQANLIDAIEGTIELDTGEKTYRLGDDPAVLLVRPRGWHLPERHVLVDGEAVSGSLFDFGLYLFHNGRRLLDKGSGPFLYLPKLESHLEARLWNDVFDLTESELDLPPGSIKATVLIETILAAFEMEEILFELRDHSAGLNAGRWDYIFSIIKKFRERPEFVLPDRAQVTMTVPFMRAYTELLVKTCHRRGAHAMGGMAAFVPSRRDPQVNEVALAKVREDKLREAGDGFDGTWVAHPDLVPVALAEFDAVLGARPNQVERLREEVDVAAGDLLDVRVPGRRGHRRRGADERQRRTSLPGVVAPGHGRGRDLQPHGGRGHGRDLALAGLAVAPPRPCRARPGSRLRGRGARRGRRGPLGRRPRALRRGGPFRGARGVPHASGIRAHRLGGHAAWIDGKESNGPTPRST